MSSDVVARVGEALPRARLLAIQHKLGTCLRTADSEPGSLRSRRPLRVRERQACADQVMQTTANGRDTNDN